VSECSTAKVIRLKAQISFLSTAPLSSDFELVVKVKNTEATQLTGEDSASGIVRAKQQT